VRLREDVLRRIGNRPIEAIKPAEIASMIIAIEERGAADVARRALQNTQQIVRYAMAFGLAEQNQQLRSALRTSSGSTSQQTLPEWMRLSCPRS
jgi:hypothetical protein